MDIYIIVISYVVFMSIAVTIVLAKINRIKELKKQIDVLKEQETRLKKELEKKKDPSNEMKAFLADLMSSGALLEVRRVDANHLYQHSPRDMG
jgi:cell division protein FtsB